MTKQGDPVLFILGVIDNALMPKPTPPEESARGVSVGPLDSPQRLALSDAEWGSLGIEPEECRG